MRRIRLLPLLLPLVKGNEDSGNEIGKYFLYLICAGIQEHFNCKFVNGIENIANYKNTKLSAFTNKANVPKKNSEVRKWKRVEADQIYVIINSAETNSNSLSLRSVRSQHFLNATRMQLINEKHFCIGE